MKTGTWQQVEEARQAAVEVLLHNAQGPFKGLPRTAGWGYPEPYTRDLLLSLLGIAVSGNEQLMGSMRRTLETLAANQSRHGHIPSLVHDAEDRGASDTTPLFLLSTAIFRNVTAEHRFLDDALKKALIWMTYQSPSDHCLVAQQPTSDWRDEQWVLGFGLFVNTVLYSALCLLGHYERASGLLLDMEHFTITSGGQHHHVHEGLSLKHKPYYALWSYKVYSSERFDLLGNSLAMLSGLSSKSRSQQIADWVGAECLQMQTKGDLAASLPPNFFPYIRPSDPDWLPRYLDFNLPGEYHNGGIWPFVSSFYIAALVAVENYDLARQQLYALTDLVRLSVDSKLEFGFNEWYRAQDGLPRGQDWQTWSAAMYLYAAKCVEEEKTPFFDQIRKKDLHLPKL